MNTSATGGYLTPDDPLSPEFDLDLDLLFQNLIVNVTGMAGKYVRPRWQSKPPKQPTSEVTWCAIGVTNIHSDYSLTMTNDELSAHETIEVLATFYGPLSMRYAAIMRDGIQIPQNNETIRKYGIVYHDFSDIRPMPEYVNEEWIRRYDLTLRFRRKMSRTYQIKDFLDSKINIGDD